MKKVWDSILSIFVLGLVVLSVIAVIQLDLPAPTLAIPVLLYLLFLTKQTVKASETRNPFRPSPLTSFESGLPVKIKFKSHTVTIDTAGVHVRRNKSHGRILSKFYSSSIDDFDAVLTDFRGVRVRGTYDLFGCEGVLSRSITINVMLVHKHSEEKNVLLAEGDWDIDFHKFSDQSFEPLKRLCADAGCALSLPVLEEGILSKNDLRKAQAAA